MDSSRIRISGPLAPHVRGFWKYLLSEGYTALTVASVGRLMADFSRWLEAHKVSVRALTEEKIESFLRSRRRRGRVGFLSRRCLDSILKYLVNIGAVRLIAKQQPRRRSLLNKILGEYSEYLCKERNLRIETRHYYLKIAEEFLATEAKSGRKLKSLSAANLSAFILREFKRNSIRSCKYAATALRSILRYLVIRGSVSTDLSTGVPSVAGWQMTSLPKALTRDEVKRLLSSCDRRTHHGRRRYAVLLLMIRLGLRAAEVAALQMEDIHWRRGEIVVHGKGGREDTLPLPEDVGRALVAYIRNSRPKTEARNVFMRVVAPRGRLDSRGIQAIVGAAGRDAGISFVSAHRLRHTAACEMLHNKVPLPEIAQVLRHRSIDTTAMYAKVDRDSLRTLAQPWPGGAV